MSAAGGTSDQDSPGLTHVDEHGQARMVDITAKAPTARRAVARCVVRTVAEPGSLGAQGEEDPMVVAQIAGIQAAKLTAQLVPLCHPILLSEISVRVSLSAEGVDIEAEAQVVDRTGVEIEALTACAIAGLSIVRSLRHVDPTAYVDDLTLWHKSGGRSGTWERATRPAT